MKTVKEHSYEDLRRVLRGFRLNESSSIRVPELEMQARLFAGEFGISWRSMDGENVRVVHFGIWNREPGPDFCRAQVLIEEVEFTGDIEIDQDARDWENHGHSRNAAYENVVLHLFVRHGPRRFFTRTAQNRAVTQVCLPPERCAKSLPRQNEALDVSDAAKLIEAAAAFRLRRKCEMFQRTTQLRDRDGALFEALAAGMGFKNNKIPFLLIAQRSGLTRAKASEGEALLFGLSGFLKAGHFDQGDHESRTYLRHLWEQWWSVRDREHRLILPESAWIFSAVRPANHPHRRLGALAAAARSFAPISRSVAAGSRDDFVEAISSLEHSFWQRHASLAGEALPKATALIGEDRLLDLLINVFLPAQRFEAAWPQLCAMPGPTPSRKILRSAEWLTGLARPAQFRSAMCQQGLLQLAEDFPHRSPQEVWRSLDHGWTPTDIV
jgi:Protein of unknown function (DUF2851)